MCGVTGWVDWVRDLRNEAEVIGAMTATMACRGPDDERLWISPRAAIGHRRLAIIDLDGGRQPMVADSGVVLTYSGELYNFAELRRELEGLGHHFKTRSDTEVVLRAYLEWDTRCVERFNGMYAFGIWDPRVERLFLVRDRLGVKPLYFYPYPDGVMFGSEPKAMLANPLFQPVLDEEGLAELFAMFGGRTPGNGVFRGLHEVRPGWMVIADRSGVRTRRYWKLRSHPHEDDRDMTIATVREILADTVRRQLVADVPLCALVSGGVDSSAVAALASDALAEQGEGELVTFAVDFARSAHDFVGDVNRPDRDAPFVAALVDHLDCNHTDVLLDTPDLLEIQGLATRARDLPSLGDLDASLYLLFKAISGRSTVALSGESADEVFGGYAWFHDSAAIGRRGFPWLMDDTGLASVLAPDLRERIRPSEYVADRYAEALGEVPRLPGETGAARRMREVGYLALTRFLPVLLDRKDRMSMAVGLEVRVPFCDHRLVEYAWNIPWELKCPNGVPKGLLRQAVADRLPPVLSQRPKSMFPVTPDPGYDALVRRRAGELVNEGSAIAPLLDRERVAALASGQSRRPPWMQRMALAYLIQVERWLRDYKVQITASV
jgi:asparagine synthase (glutamine-hydrolysing)